MSAPVIGRVVGLFRYPVKSMGAEAVASVEAGPDGFRGDRAFGLVDTSTSRLLSAKTVPLLLDAKAVFLDDGEVTMTLPTGGVVSSDDRDVDDVLSAWLGRSVRLARPPTDVASTIDIEVDLTARGGPEDAMFTFDTRPGLFFDGTPMHLLTISSLRAMEALYPTGVWAQERFRPNVLIERTESAANGFVEDAWVGTTIDVGGMEANVQKRCDRCILTTRHVAHAPADREILRALHRHHGGDLGVKATITGVGMVALGDDVRLRS
jgi:uncharacterized protein